MSDMRKIWRRAGLGIATVGTLVVAFLFFIVVAQAGSGVVAGAPASNGAQAQVLLPPAQMPPAQTASADAGAAAGSTRAATAWTIPSPAYKIFITADGVYSLTRSYLAGKGLPVDTLDPRTFRMFYMGEEIAIRVIGEGDGHFDAGDVVLFYARSVDAMYFDGLTPINKYTGTNVYWLTYGGSAGLRMAEQDGAGPGGSPGPFQHVEQLEFNLPTIGGVIQPSRIRYIPALPFQPNAEHWYQDRVNTPRTYSFTALNVAGNPSKATFTARLLSETSSPKQVRFYLNDYLILDNSTTMTGIGVFQMTALVPQDYFVDGKNDLKVEVVGSLEILVDWLRFVYDDQYVAEADVLAFSAPASGPLRYSVTQFNANDIEVYDVSDLTAPRLITPTVISAQGPYDVAFSADSTGAGRYIALTSAVRQTPAGMELVVPLVSPYTPVDLLQPAPGADYIIITHRDFFDQALRLAAHRASQYNRIMVIDVQAVYDQFNGGLMSAEAIHDFLAYARASWAKPVPMYVVLIGDGSYDMRCYRGCPLNSTPTFIPPYLALVDPVQGETATDNRIVMLVGNDLLPDMHIGRLPVNTVAEATAMVDKILAYEDENTCGCQSGGWRKNLLFITDDKDTGGDFYYYSDRLLYADAPVNSVRSALIPPTYNFTRAYLQGKYPGGTCDLASCRQIITNTLNITGALFVSFVGHTPASRSSWATDRLSSRDPAGLMNLTMINALTPNACLPIMLPMTCFEGGFHEASPTQRVLAESYTRAVDPTGVGKGAIASFSPTGLGLVSGHDLLEEGFFDAVFHKNITTLGAAATYAKHYLAGQDTTGSHRDLLDTFLVIGDPGLRIKTQASCDTPTGIVMAGFEAQPAGSGVRVSWQTNSEVKIFGFNVLRAEGAGDQPAAADYVAVNSELIFAQFSGTNQGASYAYDDAPAAVGRSRWYRLEIIGLDGSRTLQDPVEVAAPPWRVYLPQVLHVLP